VGGLVQVKTHHDLAGRQAEVVHVGDDGVDMFNAVADFTRLRDTLHVRPVVKRPVQRLNYILLQNGKQVVQHLVQRQQYEPAVQYSRIRPVDRCQ